MHASCKATDKLGVKASLFSGPETVKSETVCLLQGGQFDSLSTGCRPPNSPHEFSMCGQDPFLNIQINLNSLGLQTVKPTVMFV